MIITREIARTWSNSKIKRTAVARFGAGGSETGKDEDEEVIELIVADYELLSSGSRHS